jgi:hypothetical protein
MGVCFVMALMGRVVRDEDVGLDGRGGCRSRFGGGFPGGWLGKLSFEERLLSSRVFSEVVGTVKVMVRGKED